MMRHSRSRSGSSIGGSRCSKCPRKMWLLPGLLLCSLLRTGSAIKLLRLDVPSIADPRWDKVTLRCEYDLGGKELYSVKWYKDGNEFFRFMPSSTPEGRDFPVEGVYVDVNRSDSKQVTLLGQANTRKGKVNLVGSYGCEVSSEAPSFLTSYEVANMSVAIPPKERPNLQGLRPSYEAGETLHAECTSAPSYPAAVLAFILNGKEVNKALTKELPIRGSSDDSIVSSTRSSLSLRLERHHFPGGTLSLTCQSTLPGIKGIKASETTETATLAASNQPLAQEPPRSSSTFNIPILSTMVCCLLATIGSVSRAVMPEGGRNEPHVLPYLPLPQFHYIIVRMRTLHGSPLSRSGGTSFHRDSPLYGYTGGESSSWFLLLASLVYTATENYSA